MGNGVLVGVISSDVECPLVVLWGTPTGDRHTMTGCFLNNTSSSFQVLISNKLQLDTVNKQMLQYELLTVKNMNYCNYYLCLLYSSH